MSKSGNTWFKIKRNKGRRIGFQYVGTLRASAVTMDTVEVTRFGAVKPRKDREPRPADKRVPTGFVVQPRGARSSARRAAYYLSIGCP